MKYYIKLSDLIFDIADKIENENMDCKFNSTPINSQMIIELALLTLYEQMINNDDLEGLIFTASDLKNTPSRNYRVDFDLITYERICKPISDIKYSR